MIFVSSNLEHLSSCLNVLDGLFFPLGDGENVLLYWNCSELVITMVLVYD